MNEYTTALLQIVSTKMVASEIADGIGLRNYARQQPPPPNAYYCFETSAICDSGSINVHIQNLAKIIQPSRNFILDRVEAGDEITLLWFPAKNTEKFTILTPESMKFLADFRISFLIQNQGA